ncbi:hypothetical protein L7F22_057126 [Adiantum nelumboides]|nr:hypothetical protein [Adiantum nelumboides]
MAAGLEVWVYNPADEHDRRLPHRYHPNRPVSQAHLTELGVLHSKVDVDELQKQGATLIDRTIRDFGYEYWRTRRDQEKMAAGLEAWVYNPADEHDPRLPHRYHPNRPVSQAHLTEVGVLHSKVDVDELQKQEIVTLAPHLVENFKELTDKFFHEHLHPYDESRIILEGNGYWDIPDYDGTIIRFRVEKGDMITLPPGMYHRFTMDTNEYIKAMLLFKEVPERIDLLKPQGDETLARKEYVTNILENPLALHRKL